VNADCVNITFRDRDYLKAVQSADLVLSDGIGMKLAGKILKQEVRQNVNGTDLFPRMCAALQGTGKGIYLFGARPGVAEGVRAWVEANYPGVVVSGTRSGFFTDEEEGAIVQDIAASGASVLLVAMGAQRQDKWIHEHLQECGASVAIGVGGLFDFFSGQTNRAPQWVREMGFEWFYRVVQEPGRLWKRYFVGNGVFLFRVFRARLIGNGKASKGRNQQGA
jgi:N-acetylglucosaminyldiphosphoundecaprenol N-acetyl-beta-D-mannosaminyltransferase